MSDISKNTALPGPIRGYWYNYCLFMIDKL